MSDASRSESDDILERFVAAPSDTLRQVLELIDGNGEGVAAIVGPGRSFVGIITDGDIRRALLANADFEQTAHVLRSYPAKHKGVGFAVAAAREKTDLGVEPVGDLGVVGRE